MRKKRGFFTEVSYALSDKRVGFLIFIILSLSFVLAGNMIFDGGNVEVEGISKIDNTQPQFFLVEDDVTNKDARIQVTGGIFYISETNGTVFNVHRVRIDPVESGGYISLLSGNVGIGTATPEELLHVNGIIKQNSGFGTNFKSIRDSTPTTSAQTLGFMTWGADDGDSDDLSAGLWLLSDGAWTTSSHPSQLRLRTTASGSTSISDRLTILSNGNVGIGTTSPTQTLHVTGNANVTGTLYYGSLQANSPHMFEADEIGYTRGCWYDAKGYWNMVWFDDGVLQIDKNNQVCNDKKTYLNEVKTAQENCEEQGLLLDESDLSCYSGNSNE